MNIPKFHFNVNGLRFDPTFLSSSGMRESVLKLTVEEMAQYVDGVTYERVKAGVPITITDREIEASVKEDSWNTTSVGNLAFMAWYHPDYHVRMRAAYCIELMRKLIAQR